MASPKGRSSALRRCALVLKQEVPAVHVDTASGRLHASVCSWGKDSAGGIIEASV